jgi:hypothetical protein
MLSLSLKLRRTEGSEKLKRKRRNEKWNVEREQNCLLKTGEM